ncbi:integumentary mucin A.1-like protein [Cinnamomum micranthum f. kanehirae]|uniref:Integumentary mucin A.1-like protein n=1 Tax=Cinnamomum micranthum f. kanehirae TaxID=337451 RepID=A0A3S3R6K5_9MAGN|nr:integumentary mucin A.1-like protein [Cinnamomum micranthum f. kanehirae]
MGIKAFQLIIFLMGLFFCSGTLVRISYDGSSLSSPADLLQFVKQNESPHIRISDGNYGVLRTVCGNSIDLDLYISMKNIVAVSTSRALAVTWVQREVSSIVHCLNISAIVVSSELMTENHFPILLPALKTIDSAIKSLKTDQSIKLSVSFPLSFIEGCFRIPSKSSSPNLKDILQVLDFLRVTKSYLTVNAFCGEDLSFRDCLISVTNRAIFILRNHDIPLRINLRNPQLFSLSDKVELGDKLMRVIRKQDHVRDRMLSLFVEKPLNVEVEHKELKHEKSLQPYQRELMGSKVESVNITPQLDVITPLTTVPVTNPTTTMPVVIPIVSTPPTTIVTNASTTPTTPPISPGQSWCIASQTASQMALQVALDYACGYGGAECSAIKQGGSCYDPNTLRDHASYAYNDYYQKNPVATSCNFGGTAVLTNIDPSISTCQYASTSTSSSVLNTTNPTGAEVFGSEPSGPTNAASVSLNFTILYAFACHLMLMITVNHF